MRRMEIPESIIQPVPRTGPRMVIQSDKPMTLTIEGAAEELGVSIRTMYELVQREDFPAMKIGKSWRVSTRCLEEWIAEKATKKENI